MRRIELLGIPRALCFATGVVLAMSGPSEARSGGQVPAKPVWPDNGIAQRVFPNGSTMFVESEQGRLRAWVLSETTGSANVEALDFFSGQRLKVKVDLESDGRQEQSFTDAQGRDHFSIGRDFAFSGTSMPVELPGLDFDGNTLQLDGAINNCLVNITAVTPSRSYGVSQQNTAGWSKFPIYHLLGGPKGCPSGFFHSKVTSALDLNDGTFLASEGCFVFRLRKSDLSPVGSAPSLSIVDESVVAAAIEKANGQNIEDATAYLAKALNLPTNPELSCKDD